ncbi:MAG: (R)-amidase [Gaiellaceae bacterium]|nr:(R)-amidase [Gaiellaceae bacterium]
MLALLAQLAATPGDPAANAQRAADAIRAHPQADLAVFPELYLSGYDLALLDGASRESGCDELARVAAAAEEADTAVVIGFSETLPAGGRANAAACIDRDGALVAVYRKSQLFGAEAEAFEPGGELRVVRLAGRSVGVMICFDVEFPEVARRLARAGADLLVTASANMDPFYRDHEVATCARALENRLPHLYANMVGEAGGVRFVGGSRSVGSGGEVLGEAAHDGEELLLVRVGDAGVDDERVDYLRHLPADVPVVAS